jgi:hypothetical protein
MTVSLERPPESVRGQQLPLPMDLEPQAGPPPVLPPHLVWAALPPLAQAQVRAIFILVAREVLHAADRR